MNKLFFCFMTCVVSVLFPQEVKDEQPDWLSFLFETTNRVAVNSREITYKDIIGTYWVLADPFVNISDRDETMLIAVSTGYVFLTESDVLIVETLWSAMHISEYNPNIQDELSSEIVSIRELTQYGIESDRIIFKFDHLEGYLENNYLYLRKIQDPPIYKKYYLKETFPVTSPEGETLEGLWIQYIR